VIASLEYGTSEKCGSDTSGLPVLRMGNIQDSEITLENLKYLLPPLASDAPLLEVGDILFNRTNSEELVGKSAIVNDLRQPTSFASYLIRLKTEPDFDSAFVVTWLNSAYGRRWIRANKSQQVGQANLSGGMPGGDEENVMVLTKLARDHAAGTGVIFTLPWRGRVAPRSGAGWGVT
jgi:type I restriction enzyme, S subunit